jgi:hypothetical protein
LDGSINGGIPGSAPADDVGPVVTFGPVLVLPDGGRVDDTRACDRAESVEQAAATMVMTRSAIGSLARYRLRGRDWLDPQGRKPDFLPDD